MDTYVARRLGQVALLLACLAGLAGLGWLMLPRPTPAAPPKPTPPVVPTAAEPEPEPEPPAPLWRSPLRPEGPPPPALPRTLRGRVEAAGQPLADVALVLEAPHGSLHDRRVVSGTDGRFVLPVDAGHLPAWLLAEHPDGRALRQRLTGVDLHAELLLRLDQTAVLRGRVLAAGRPLPDAELFLLTAPPADGALPSARARSDGAGVFELEGVAAEQTVLLARHPRYQARWQQVAPRAGAVLSVEIELDPGCSLAGTVQRAGLPVAQVMIQAQGRETHSDVHGRFELAGLTPGTCELTARAGSELLRRGLELPEAGLRGVLLELADGLRRGSLLDAEGRPLAGASLWLTHASGQWHTISDAEGRFELSALEGGSYLVDVQSPQHRRSFAVELPESTSAELRWQLPPLASLQAVLYADGQTLSGARLDVQRLLPEGFAEAQRLTLFSDGAGQLRFRQLEPGRYRLWASAEGRVPRALEVELPAAIRIDLPSGVEVELQLRRPFAAELEITLTGEAGRFGSWTDERGRAHYVIPPGAYTLEGAPHGTTLRWLQQQAVWDGAPLQIEPPTEDLE